MNSLRTFWAGLFAITGAALITTETCAQSYPTRHVRIITAGAGTIHDVVARQLGQRLAERWGQPVVIENQPAAGLTIGAAIAATAPPDGYTLLLGDRSSLAAAPSLHRNLRYDPFKDFVPITLVARAPAIFTAHPSLPANNLKEFIAYARRQSEPILFAAPGVGSLPHLTAMQFGHATDIKLMPVHYKGGGPAAMAVLAGEVKIAFLGAPTVLPQIRAGKLKAFAVTGLQRFIDAPDIPTADEAGVPGFESEQWIGMVVPARTPVPIAERLNRDIVELLRTPAFQDLLRAQGGVAAPGTPSDFSRFMASERQRLKTLIDSIGLTAI
jgi:tripartite-type tricarboxylate transporter receptor subunit TctC